MYANHLSEAMKDATDGVAGMIRAQGEKEAGHISCRIISGKKTWVLALS
jgi:pyridoxal biosynthesis lyase PdxS